MQEVQSCAVHPQPGPGEVLEMYKAYDTKKQRLALETYRREHVYPGKLKKLASYTPGNRLLDIGAGLEPFYTWQFKVVSRAQELSCLRAM